MEARLSKIPFSASILAAGLALSACASTGVDPDAAKRFTPNVTTRTEVIAKLGPPASIYGSSDGSITLTWAKGGNLFDPGTKSLSIRFGPDDRMMAVVAKP